MYPRLECLKFSCHPGSEEDLVYSLLRVKAVFFFNFLYFTDSKSEEWEKIGNISLESHSQIFEETRRIQDPVQFIMNDMRIQYPLRHMTET